MMGTTDTSVVVQASWAADTTEIMMVTGAAVTAEVTIGVACSTTDRLTSTARATTTILDIITTPVTMIRVTPLIPIQAIRMVSLQLSSKPARATMTKTETGCRIPTAIPTNNSSSILSRTTLISSSIHRINNRIRHSRTIRTSHGISSYS